MPTRKHLFKAKRKDNGGWVKGSLITYKDGDCFICVEELTDVLNKYEVDPETICECTGVPDKNGDEIFEGDICKDIYDTKFKVKWDNVNARFLGHTLSCYDNTGYFVKPQELIYVGRESKVEIIGNIYDNPELLEVKA